MAIRWRAVGSILSSQKTPTWSDEGASALRPTVVGNSADGGGADGGHLGRGRMEDPKKLETPKKGDATARPFIFSEGLPPVAAKLVARILRGLCRHGRAPARYLGGAAEGRPAVAGKYLFIHSSSPEVRSYGHLKLSVVLWGVYCSGGEQVYPEHTHKLLPYQTLVVWEARRCGGRGGVGARDG